MRGIYIPIILLPKLLDIKISGIIFNAKSISNYLYTLGSLINESL